MSFHVLEMAHEILHIFFISTVNHPIVWLYRHQKMFSQRFLEMFDIGKAPFQLSHPFPHLPPLLRHPRALNRAVVRLAAWQLQSSWRRPSKSPVQPAVRSLGLRLVPIPERPCLSVPLRFLIPCLNMFKHKIYFGLSTNKSSCTLEVRR